MVYVSKVADNIYIIDSQLYGVPRFGAVYLLTETRKALVDTSATTSAHLVIEGIREVGVRPEDIDYLIVTHVHLDHGGGAGALLKHMPKAKVVVHHNGARHLADPSNLVKSAIQVQGKEAMARAGEVVPIAEDRLQVVQDSATIKLSDRQVLDIFDAQGHCTHQINIYESRNRGIFVGDAVGNYIAEYEILVPITPSPSFDPERYFDTLEKLKTLHARKIYFAHFGVTDKVQESLELAAEKIRRRQEIVQRAIQENRLEAAAEEIVADACQGLAVVKEKMPALYDYWTTSSIPMSAAGFVHYYKRRLAKERR
ncbi:MAG: MBL fold metallo-hydrolase [Chloroflexi bacterium]|nr:MBL fold metallo-hydrolase [Chloroflexota bacterium]